MFKRKGGGGKGLLKNVKKTALFLHDGFPNGDDGVKEDDNGYGDFDNGDGDDYNGDDIVDDNGDGDGDGATQLGGEHDGVGGTKTQSCGGLCIQTSGGLQ